MTHEKAKQNAKKIGRINKEVTRLMRMRSELQSTISCLNDSRIELMMGRARMDEDELAELAKIEKAEEVSPF